MSETAQLEQLKDLGFNNDDSLNIMKKFESSEDFTLKTARGKYRFIHDDFIIDVLEEKLIDDAYLLGSIEAWFIAETLNIPLDSVEKIQKAHGYQALGDAMLRYVDVVANKYASLQGYGSLFSRYDGSEELLSNGYYVFRIN